MQTSKESSGADKQGLWGWWHSHQQWSDRLHRKAAHKALDIEDDAMIVSNRGIGAGGVIGILWIVCCMLLIAASAPFAYSLWLKMQTPAASSPVDADYEVRFYDAAGNEVRLDRWQGNAP